MRWFSHTPKPEWPLLRFPGHCVVWLLLAESDLPQSIGRLSAFMGNAGVLLRAYIYMRLLGRDGMRRVGEYATLNANYLLQRLRDAGFDPVPSFNPYWDRDGVTFEDPDGYRIVLQKAAWTR